MPRPLPLRTLVTSARPHESDNRLLTPRTPHSRSGRAEEGYTVFEMERMREQEEDDHHQSVAQQQSVPLLASSAGEHFPSHTFLARDYKDNLSTKRKSARTLLSEAISRLPLTIGIPLAAGLVILIVLSFKHPEALHEYIGAAYPSGQSSGSGSQSTSDSPTPTPTSTAISEHNLISYENYTTFPLRPSEYLSECKKLNFGYMSHGDYWEPHIGHEGVMDVPHHDTKNNYKLPESEMTTVCKSTITYMLDGKVGLLADLALMAQTAALARERNRTFLVDDTYWNRGKWMDHFQDIRSRQPGPEPGCVAPPANELVACPRLARHWVVNSRTAKFHLGHAFSDHYQDPYAHQLNRLKPIYDGSTQSFELTIRPNAHTAQLIRLARSELSMKLGHGTPYTSVHIRHGDRKSSSYHYHGSPVPITEFSQATSDAWMRLGIVDTPSTTPYVYVATDSPAAEQEFANNFQGPTFSLSQSEHPELKTLASRREYRQAEFNELPFEQRTDATRGMIIDFAMISGMWAWDGEIIPDATVCTITSNVCKMAAVGLGWDRAFGQVDSMGDIDEKHKRWIEIDQKGIVVPLWQAFELF